MIDWFARHPNAANLLMAAIMILGLTALPGLQRETLPEIKNDQVEIRVVYKGATAEEAGTPRPWSVSIAANAASYLVGMTTLAIVV